MTELVWPEILPVPRREGHAYQATDLVEASEMEGGPRRTRQKFSSGPTTFGISFSLNEEQWLVFEGFHTYELFNGSQEFTLPLHSGVGVTYKRVKFVGPPSFDAGVGATHCRVTATVEVQQSMAPTFAQYEEQVAASYSGTAALFITYESLLDQVINTDLPAALE